MKDTSILTNNGVNVQASLELFGDMEMYDETLGDFLDMSDEKITTLENYKNSNDMPNYAIAVHALKSDARYLGFTTLADLAYESEMKSKAGDSVFVAENHPKILQEAKRVINLSQQYMGREITAVIPEGAAAVVQEVPVQAQEVVAQPQEMVAQPQQVMVEQPVMATPVDMSAQVVMTTPVATEVVPVQNDVYVVQQPVESVAVQSYAQPTVPVQGMVEQVMQPVQTFEQVVQPVQPVEQVVQTPVQPVVMQTEPVTQVVPPAPVAPVSEPVAPIQPVSAPAQQEVQINFSNAGGPVSSQVQPAVSTEPLIQFFPADDFKQQDVMSSALSMQQQVASQTSVAAVKQGIILVVDDSPLVANFVKKIFSKNYEVIIANDGKKAIEIINDDSIRSKIKTCLLDLNMPNVSGFDVMDYFREKGVFVKTPVAVISGAEDAPTLDKARSYPIIDVLAKPFNERDVQRVVEKCLACYF